MSGENLSDLLRIFRAVVDGESFSAAGRQLNMSPAWVAKQVTRLEAHLDTALLIRSTRSLRLTDAGQECYRTAGKVADELSALKNKMHSDARHVSGSVRINVPSIVAMHILAPHLAGFQRSYPNVHLDVSVSESFVDVQNEDVDIVFRVVNALGDSSAIVQQVAEVPRVLCAAQSYWDGAPATNQISDLKAHNALMFSGLQSPMQWLLQHNAHQEWVAPTIAMQANNSFILKQAALDGAGLAFLPRIIVEAELASGQLVQLDHIRDAAPFGLFLLRAPQKHVPARVQVAWRYFAKVCRRFPALDLAPE
ncbi:MAG: LysR family transcriptional regulator [Thalassovita sp.]